MNISNVPSLPGLMNRTCMRSAIARASCALREPILVRLSDPCQLLPRRRHQRVLQRLDHLGPERRGDPLPRVLVEIAEPWRIRSRLQPPRSRVPRPVQGRDNHRRAPGLPHDV